ncbi:MAG: SDR family oxidoreductase [Nitrospirota bacterium]
MQKRKPVQKIHPAQKQNRPGLEKSMSPSPVFDTDAKPGNALAGKVALITGGDSGIGRAIAVGFAKQGADVAICFLKAEQNDAETTRSYISTHYGKECLLLPGDLGHESQCIKVVNKTVKHFNQLDIVINNAGLHYPQDGIEKISSQQLHSTFELNVFAMFYIVKAALKHLKRGSTIINTTSVTAYRGSAHLIDYAASKGAIVSFTRSLAASLVDKEIRVNAVAPGPVWTPLIVSSLKKREVETFGSDSPMARAGEPVEIAACFLFLASEASSFITGQVLHPNGGEIING